MLFREVGQRGLGCHGVGSVAQILLLRSGELAWRSLGFGSRTSERCVLLLLGGFGRCQEDFGVSIPSKYRNLLILVSDDLFESL